MAEREAVRFIGELPPNARFSYCAINPSGVYGPVLHRRHLQTSATIVHDLMTGKFPMNPEFAFPLCDVRDVALAHVLAMEAPNVTGRLIVSCGKCVRARTPWRNAGVLHARSAAQQARARTVRWAPRRR